jgi:hypothetical protein
MVKTSRLSASVDATVNLILNNPAKLLSFIHIDFNILFTVKEFWKELRVTSLTADTLYVTFVRSLNTKQALEPTNQEVGRYWG